MSAYLMTRIYRPAGHESRRRHTRPCARAVTAKRATARDRMRSILIRPRAT